MLSTEGIEDASSEFRCEEEFCYEEQEGVLLNISGVKDCGG